MNEWKTLEHKIVETISNVARQHYEIYSEKWVSGKELCQQIAMFSPNWLEKYGWKLPRERIEVTDDEGERRVTRWGYPLHHIQMMIAEGRLRSC